MMSGNLNIFKLEDCQFKPDQINMMRRCGWLEKIDDPFDLIPPATK
jgi:hypothetical protein